MAALLACEGAQSTAVTASKSRISSQGMGGVGKTMLTAAGTADAVFVSDLMRSIALFVCVVVRDERLRAGFKVGKTHSTACAKHGTDSCARVVFTDDLLVEPKSAA